LCFWFALFATGTAGYTPFRLKVNVTNPVGMDLLACTASTTLLVAEAGLDVTAAVNPAAVAVYHEAAAVLDVRL
jgi:hypothetical protein